MPIPRGDLPGGVYKMTIDKAIEILEEHAHKLELSADYDECDATKLGIEALKRIRHDRLVIQAKHILLLPGETKDY